MKKSEIKKVSVTLAIDENIYREFSALCKKKGWSRSWNVQEMMMEFLLTHTDKLEKSAKRS